MFYNQKLLWVWYWFCFRDRKTAVHCYENWCDIILYSASLSQYYAESYFIAATAACLLGIVCTRIAQPENIFAHSSLQCSSISVRLHQEDLQISILKSCCRFSIRFRSRLWLNHSNTYICFDLTSTTGFLFPLFRWGKWGEAKLSTNARHTLQIFICKNKSTFKCVFVMWKNWKTLGCECFFHYSFVSSTFSILSSLLLFTVYLFKHGLRGCMETKDQHSAFGVAAQRWTWRALQSCACFQSKLNILHAGLSVTLTLKAGLVLRVHSTHLAGDIAKINMVDEFF